MTEDDIILYGTTILCILANLYLLKINKKTALVIISIFLIYSLYFHYKLMCCGRYGSGFLWWFYLIVLNAINVLFDFSYIIYRRYASK